MKLIVATVKTENWKAVYEALKPLDVYLMYVSTVGDLRDTVLGSYRGAAYREPRQRARLEIIVMNDLVVEDVVEAIKEAVVTDEIQNISNGSIFVLPLEDWMTLSATRPRPLQDVQDPDQAPAVRMHAS